MFQLVDGHMGSQVIDAIQGLAERYRVGLSRRHSYQKRPGQSGSGGNGDGVDIAEPDPGLGERPVNRRHHGLQMGPAGDLRHYAAESGVLVDA